MPGFPQITEEDIQEFDRHLTRMLELTEASLALIVEKAGHLIHQSGEIDKFDTRVISTLASNAYNASAFLASLLNETKITGMTQQGEKFSTMILEIDEHCILVVVYKSSLSSGAIKYYASLIIPKIAEQIRIAKERAPDLLFDFTDLNTPDAQEFLKKSNSKIETKSAEVKQQIFPSSENPEGSRNAGNKQ
ncbi:MAG: roadblock/LC7 domain-containing protein [Verrucomicrobiia bacterium]